MGDRPASAGSAIHPLTPTRSMQPEGAEDELEAVANSVFDALAGSEGVLDRESFQQCSIKLAKLSPDFVDEDEGFFDRVDANSDSAIERSEFLEEVKHIRALVGSKQVLSALNEVAASLEKRDTRTDLMEMVAEKQILRKLTQQFQEMTSDYSKQLTDLDAKIKDLGGVTDAQETTPFAAEASRSIPPKVRKAKVELPSVVENEEELEEEEENVEAADDEQKEPDECEDEEPECNDEAEEPEEEDDDEEDDADEEDADDDEDEEEDEDDEQSPKKTIKSTAPKSGGSKGDKTSSTAKQAAITEATRGASEGATKKVDVESAKPIVDARVTQGAIVGEPAAAKRSAAGKGEDKVQGSSDAAPAKAKGKKKVKVSKPVPVSSKKPLMADKETSMSDREDYGITCGDAGTTGMGVIPVRESPAADAEEEAAGGGGVAKQSRRPSKPGGKNEDNEGAQCVQTLELGCAIRAAFCIGRDVWTVDQVGKVTVRERDNAAKVKAEVTTGAFVLCMARLEPDLMLLGMERGGIAVFNTAKKQALGSLGSLFGGSVMCLALGEGNIDDGATNGVLPTRRFWSAGNDFTIRSWTVDTRMKDAPDYIDDSKGNGFSVGVGKWKVSISTSLRMHGHKNGVRCMLRIGPTLWSGSDDGTIRLWLAADGSEVEVVEDAHQGSVLKLSVVRSFVWSCGMDGLIKEWSIGGPRRQLLRKFAPEGSEKGVYAAVPLGHDVWTCGHHPKIQIYTQHSMQKTAELEAHASYVSNLLAVDRIETKIVWSTSIGDRKLKVWRTTIRGEVPNYDEMKAANKLYEDESEGHADRLRKYAEEKAQLQKELKASQGVFNKALNKISKDLAKAQAEMEEMMARKKRLEDELRGIAKLFEDAGLGHLMKDPAAMRAFLARAAEIEKVLRGLGLERLLNDPEALKRFLEAALDLQKFLEQAGFGDVFSDPAKMRELKEALNALGRLKEVAAQYGFGNIFSDPSQLEAMCRLIESAAQLKATLNQYGYGDAFTDPSKLAEILSRYNALRDAFAEYGFEELFEDPDALKGFLQNYSKIRDLFKQLGLEYLLDSWPAMRDFLNKHGAGEQELKDARLRAARLEELQDLLARRDGELAKSRASEAELRKRLAEYEALGTLDDVKRWRRDASEYNVLLRNKLGLEDLVADLRRQLQQVEEDRLAALENERLMSLRYKELDIFKLDIIARELKALDNELGYLGKEVKFLTNDAARLKDLSEQAQIGMHSSRQMDMCHQLRAHIRDVINKCLSETQKLHIGAATDDPSAAGLLKDGGVMAGFEAIDLPAHGSSTAARLRQDDEVGRDRMRALGGVVGPGVGGRPQSGVSRPSSPAPRR